ncbi:hypothetical protein J684_3926 [Acinetobacter baumannii 466215]|nr:hypothetical protein J684_3926 [Acinetobacter baumannii 466215]
MVVYVALQVLLCQLSVYSEYMQTLLQSQHSLHKKQIA